MMYKLNQLKFFYGQLGVGRKVDELVKAWTQAHNVSLGKLADKGISWYFTWQQCEVNIVLSSEPKVGH